MAEKEKTLERIVTIPLRASCVKKPRDERTKRAIMTIREYVFRHTDADEVKVSRAVNETIWKRGKQKPQGKIKVKLTVTGGVATARLPDEKEEPKAEKKGAAASLKERITGKKAEAKDEGVAKEEKIGAKDVASQDKESTKVGTEAKTTQEKK